MASTTVADFYRPWRRRRDTTSPPDADRERRIGRVATLCWAAALAGFACFCIWWQQRSGETLIRFALGVMIYAYAGLLGVFFTALFTRRGNAASAAAAMLTGFAAVLALEPMIFERWSTAVAGAPGIVLSFPWRLTIAAILSALVCMIPARTAHA